MSQTFSCILLISNSMVSRAILKRRKKTLVSFSKISNSTRLSDSCYVEVFEKLTRACFFPNCTRNHAITYTKPRSFFDATSGNYIQHL